MKKWNEFNLQNQRVHTYDIWQYTYVELRQKMWKGKCVEEFAIFMSFDETKFEHDIENAALVCKSA